MRKTRDVQNFKEAVMRFARFLIAPLMFTVGLALQVPALSAAQDHVVSPTELQQAAASKARTRQENIAQVQSFVSSQPVQKAMKTARLDPVQVRKAVPTLSDAELARLASQSAKAQKDFAAGALTNEQLTYIAIALAAAVIVLIATH
jgi:hypothetical protein